MLAENGILRKDPSKCDRADGMSPNSTGSYIPVDGDQYGMNSTVDGDRVVSFFNALHPKSTAMVMAGRSVHLTTLFPGQA